MKLRTSLDSTVRAAAVALVLMGIAVLGGWWLGVRWLTSVLPGLATMKPDTALGFVLSGAALLLGATPDPPPRSRVVSLGCAAAVLLLGGLTWGEYRLGWELGLDGLLVRGMPPPSAAPAPWRMSEMTAIAFFLSGGALLALRRRPRWDWVQLLALLVMGIAVTALVGYAYGVHALYAVDPFSSLALHTAAGFGVLSAALLAARPDRGLVALLRGEGIGGVAARRLLVAAVGVPVVIGWLMLLGERAGLYELEFGQGLFVVATIVTLVGLVWVCALRLNRSERQRRDLEAQLLHAQKMEAVGRLAGGIAHDFNNLLTAIITTADLAREEFPSEHTTRDLGVIGEAALGAAKLTRQLLAFSRKQILRPRPVDVDDVVHGAEPIVRRLLADGIALHLRLAGDLGPVRVDPGQLEQVLVNLVVNARDAMPGGGALTVETSEVRLDSGCIDGRTEIAPGRYVCLVVSDTGVGIEQDVLDRIFEPFFTTKEAGKGTGLGLSTTYGIIRQSGGEVVVHSESGHGTTFRVYLPRIEGVARPIERVEGSVGPPAGGTETILVVDDEPLLLDVVGKILRRAGYSVLTASGPADALAVATTHPARIDLLVTDVVMPEMGAAALVDELTELHPEASVVYVSGYGAETIARQGLLPEGVRLLEKPFGPRDLLRQVREALDEPRPGLVAAG